MLSYTFINSYSQVRDPGPKGPLFYLKSGFSRIRVLILKALCNVLNSDQKFPDTGFSHTLLLNFNLCNYSKQKSFSGRPPLISPASHMPNAYLIS